MFHFSDLYKNEAQRPEVMNVVLTVSTMVYIMCFGLLNLMRFPQVSELARRPAGVQ